MKIDRLRAGIAGAAMILAAGAAHSQGSTSLELAQ